MTRISVVTAVYNNCDTLVATLDSVLAQTHPAVEPIVVDGCSTDGSLQILERYAGRLLGFVSEPDSGLYDALNKGIARATGDVVGFLHADDVYADADVLRDIAGAFADPEVDAVYGDLVYVSPKDVLKVVRYWRAGCFTVCGLRGGWMPPHPTFYVRRSVYERVGGFDTALRISADYDSMIRMLFVAGIKVAYLPRVLVRMRTGGTSNRSLRNLLLKSSEDLSIVRRHGVGGLNTVLRKNTSKISQYWHR